MIVVRTAWGDDESYPGATEWDIDRDHDLIVVAESSDGALVTVATYSFGQWLRVRTDGTAPG